MSGFITNSNSTGDLVAHTTGDVKEAIERTREAEAYSLEAYTRRFAGDKDYAKRYMAAKTRRASGR
ncbi:hypothetical protein [Arthrobacter burdickii]|uniref:Histidinol dehydrogenase n=1 Tax=Arthrobacter burdickii TaxID=3035920 RepID=A0ABT8K219_9MICC|nr:hypothetical protein [Arthrobacter burdickii]MDN4611475.1 hypothetical protein [Arthrobacter burdickii]